MASIIITFVIFNEVTSNFNNKDYLKIKFAISKINYFWIFLAIFSCLIGIYLRSLKWAIILDSIEYKPNIKNVVASVSSYGFANSIIPRTGIFLRCFLLNKTDKIPINVSLGTIMLERLVDTFFLFIIIFLSFILNLDLFYNLLDGYTFKKINVNYVIGFTFIILLLLYFTNKFKNDLFEFFKKDTNNDSFVSGFFIGLKSFKDIKNKKTFFLYTTLSWLSFFLITYFTINSFNNLYITLSQTLFIFTLGIIGYLIPTPGGIGSYHAAIIIAFSMLKLDPISAFAVAFISHLIPYILGLLTGFMGTIYAYIVEKNMKSI